MFKLVVLSCVVALVAAKPSAIAPWGLGLAGPLVAPGLAAAPLGLGLGHGALWGAPALAAYNYRGPLSLAPGQPANILAPDGRPLDTLSVNLDRAAHLTARAVDHAGLHLLKKRSAVLGAPLAVSHTARIDLPAARLVGPAHVGALGWPAVGALGWPGAAAPWGVAGPLGVGRLGVAPLGVGPLGHAGLGHLW